MLENMSFRNPWEFMAKKSGHNWTLLSWPCLAFASLIYCAAGLMPSLPNNTPKGFIFRQKKTNLLVVVGASLKLASGRSFMLH